MAPNDQSQDYESELAAQQQQARLLQQQQRIQRMLGLTSQTKQIAGQGLADQAKEMAKKQVKKMVLKWVLGIIAAILADPITWFVLFALVIIIFGYWCVQPATNIPNCAGIVGWGIVDIFKVVF